MELNIESILQAMLTLGFPIVFHLIFWKFDRSLSLLIKVVNNNTTAV